MLDLFSRQADSLYINIAGELFRLLLQHKFVLPPSAVPHSLNIFDLCVHAYMFS